MVWDELHERNVLRAQLDLMGGAAHNSKTIHDVYVRASSTQRIRQRGGVRDTTNNTKPKNPKPPKHHNSRWNGKRGTAPSK